MWRLKAAAVPAQLCPCHPPPQVSNVQAVSPAAVSSMLDQINLSINQIAGAWWEVRALAPLRSAAPPCCQFPSHSSGYSSAVPASHAAD